MASNHIPKIANRILQPDEFIPIESAIRDLERRSRNSDSNLLMCPHKV